MKHLSWNISYKLNTASEKLLITTKYWWQIIVFSCLCACFPRRWSDGRLTCIVLILRESPPAVAWGTHSVLNQPGFLLLRLLQHLLHLLYPLGLQPTGATSHTGEADIDYTDMTRLRMRRGNRRGRRKKVNKHAWNQNSRRARARRGLFINAAVET